MTITKDQVEELAVNIHKIKTLYAGGCSWTAGNGVTDDKIFDHLSQEEKWHVTLSDYAWPKYLVDMLHIKNCINDASGAASNFRIVRRLIDFIQTLSEDERESTLVIIGWTLSSRNEIFLDDIPSDDKRDGNWHRFNITQGVSYTAKGNSFTLKKLNEYMDLYAELVFSQTAAHRTMLQQMFLVKNMLENLKIPFLFFTALPSIFPEEIDEKITAQLKSIQSNNIIDVATVSMVDFVMSNKLPIATCCHPLPSAHQQWAEYLLREIYKRKII